MKKHKCLLILITFLFVHVVYSQQSADENKEKIATVVEDYFDLEREAIHLHIDKTTFITNESIWYQGYIINRKTQKPFFTTNVFILLYDEKGNQLSEKLIFANNGYFSGKIALDPALHSGNYYIQVYTNWMNNFSENESTVTKINIINPTEGIKNYKKISERSLEITLTPEGNSYINGTSNVVGIQLKDCRGNAPTEAEASLVNSRGEILKTFKLNAFGLGKFEVTPDNENLKVVVEYNGKTIEKQLPPANKIGFAITTNDYTREGVIIVKIKTNALTLNAVQNKKLYLLAHQDQKYSIYDIVFKDNLEQTIYLNTTDLWPGTNTLRMIDSNLNQWNERLIYCYPEIKNTSLVKNKKEGGNISFTGIAPFANAYMSVTVLPEETKCWDNPVSIFSGLTVDPYLNEPLNNSYYYFNSLGRAKFYELDLALLNQAKTKYEWNYMKSNPPTSNYSFDIGITVKGKINPSIKNKTYHKVKLVSYKDFIMASSDINENGEYTFEHLLIADSTFVKMSLQKLPNFDVVEEQFAPQVINRKRTFYKPFKINLPDNYEEPETVDFNEGNDFPKLSSRTIHLKAVTIEGPSKHKLIYDSRFGNSYLRGYKIDESMATQDVLLFIEMNGFIVDKSAMDVAIYSKLISSIKGARATPQIYIDERLIMTNSELIPMSMSDIDEIYINARAIVPGVNNKEGIIKIYRKKNISTNYTKKQDVNSFYIKEGYTRYSPFKNLDYENTQNDAFGNYGLLYWLPRVAADENRQFTFKITDYNKEKGNFIIEGMSLNGELFQEEKLIELK